MVVAVSNLREVRVRDGECDGFLSCVVLLLNSQIKHNSHNSFLFFNFFLILFFYKFLLLLFFFFFFLI